MPGQGDLLPAAKTRLVAQGSVYLMRTIAPWLRRSTVGVLLRVWCELARGSCDGGILEDVRD